METKTEIKRWDNPTPMGCCSRSSSRAGEEFAPGGNEFSCNETACFVAMKDETAVAFYCYRHGKETAVSNGQSNAGRM